MSKKNMQFENFLVDETTFKTLLTPKHKKRKTWTPTDNKNITSFLPGTVTHILVNKGEQVNAGQTVIRFEAMKMINTVKALVSGKIKEVHVKEGDKFPKGFLLMEFE